MDTLQPEAAMPTEPGTETGAPRRWTTLAALILALAALFAFGYLPKLRQRALLTANTAEHAAEPTAVALTRPTRTEPARALSLPCNVQGLEETVIYARTDGYLARWLVDLGDRVSEGQVLAELDTPEASSDLAQAREQLAHREAAIVRAQAARDRSAANLRRYDALEAGLASHEELDQKRAQAQLDAADVLVAQAEKNAQRASLERLQLTQAYAKVRAPFTGTITARNIERGSLVAAGRTPLFKLTTLHTVRAFVQVPQSQVAAVRVGLPARVSVAEYPGVLFEGTVHRTAQSLDSSSRTMAVEVRVPNPERKLLPGMYGSATLTLTDATSLFRVPATALITGESRLKLARVDDEGRVQLIAVAVERDRGAELEIASGLSGGEQIIVNPSPGLMDGTRVRPAAHGGETR